MHHSSADSLISLIALKNKGRPEKAWSYCLFMHQYLTADRIHDGHRFLPEGTVIELNPECEIIALHPAGRVAGHFVRQLKGTICPGFINAHCHLELSHLKDKIPEGGGLVEFLKNVVQLRDGFTPAEKAKALQEAVDASLRNGIVAIGDIANTTDTLPVRAEGQLHVHTFVECIGFQEQYAAPAFERSERIFEQYAEQTASRIILKQSIVPHAPYSVSPALFSLISRHEPSSVLSVHNEESAAENEYYRTKTGAMKELFAFLSIDDGNFTPSGKTSLQTYLPYCSEAHPAILVHNTFMEQGDIAWLTSTRREIYLCLCPNANRYIERRLPPVYDLFRSGIPVCIGTDSLGSNHQLCVFSELKTLQKYFPELSWEILLQCATINGARALGMERLIGSITPGKKPGLCLIDFTMSKVQRLDGFDQNPD